MKPRKHILLMVGLVGIFTFLSYAQSIKPGTAVVTGNRVNVRGRPLGTAERCCQLDEGEKVTVLDSTFTPDGAGKSDEWVRVVMPEKATVWVRSSFVGEGNVINAKVTGRAGSSLMWPIICNLNKGDKVNVRTNHLDWTGIVPPPTAWAFISSRFLSNVVEASSVSTPASVPADKPAETKASEENKSKSENKEEAKPQSSQQEETTTEVK